VVSVLLEYDATFLGNQRLTFGHSLIVKGRKGPLDIFILCDETTTLSQNVANNYPVMQCYILEE